MLRRWTLVLAVVASLLMSAAPTAVAAAARSGYHYQERGSGLNAFFSNVAWDEEGNLLPGDYAETYVYGARYLAKGDGSWTDQYVCVEQYTFSIDADGNWTDGSWFGACGSADTLTLDQRLNNGRLVAAFVAEECVAWDDETGDCLDWVTLGDVAVDLTFTGTGRAEQWHGTGTGGTAGMYQYTSHGVGTDRAADVAGTVTLNGASLTEGATMTGAWMSSSKSGYVEVWH